MSDEHPWRYVWLEADGRKDIEDATGGLVCGWDMSHVGVEPPTDARGRLMARAPILLAERDRLIRWIDAIADANSNPYRAGALSAAIESARNAVVRIRIVEEETKP